MSETIFRIRHGKENPYLQFSRETAQNKKISYEASGMLSYLLSKPKDWQVRITDLMREGCGRDKVYSILKELSKNCYIKRERLQDSEGKFIGIVYLIFEEPFTENPEMDEGEPFTEKPYTAKPDTAKPDTANPTLHNKDKDIDEIDVERQEDTKKKSDGIKTSVTRQKPRLPKYQPLETISENPEVLPKRNIVLAINSMIGNGHLTEAMERTLESEIPYAIDGETYTPMSPADLFEQDGLFANYVRTVPTLLKQVKKRSTPSNFLRQVCGFHWENGWAKYEKKHRKMFVDTGTVIDSEVDFGDNVNA